jgi:branched-chain amino acid transport system substrate-binding protein
MRITGFKLGVAAVVAAGALILSGCSASTSGGGTKSATGTPIKVAALSGLTYFPEAPQAVKAVFDDYNKAGGFHGRPLQYTVYDDKTDPAVSATDAKNALSSGAVALVGSSSLLDCAVNNKTWEQNNIVSIQGTGVDPFCFTSPNIAPTNDGPYFDTAATLYDGSEILGYKNICAEVVPDNPAGKAAYQEAIDSWSKKTGKKLAYADFSLVRGQASYAGNVAALKAHNCGAVVITEVGAAVTAFIGEATNQGLKVPFLVLTSCYSDQFAAGISFASDIHLPAEFSPFSDLKNTSNKDWAAVMDAHNVPKTSFAQGGYLAAKYFIGILDTIKGKVTRASFTAAAKAMKTPISNPMVGTKWIFGPGSSHQANASAWPVEIKANTKTWTSLGPWLTGQKIGWVNTKAP